MTGHFWHRFFLLLAFVCMTVSIPATSAQSNRPIVLDGKQTFYAVGLYMDFLEDRTKLLTIDSIASEAYHGQFQRSTSEAINFGYSSSAYWVRFTIQSTSEHEDSWYLESKNYNIKRIDVFMRDGSDWLVKSGGLSLPFSERVVQHRYFLFPIVLQPNDRKTFYVRFESDGNLTIPLKLWRTDAFIAKDRKEIYVLGLYFGIAIALILYNLFLFLTLRDTTYLIYVLFNTLYASAIFIFNGFAYEFFPTDIAEYCSRRLIFFLYHFSVVFAIWFIRSFLETPRYVPRLDKVLLTLLVCFSSVALGAFFLDYGILSRSVNFLTLPTALVALTVGVIRVRQGNRPARYFLIGWTVYLVGAMLFQLHGFGAVPSHFITEQSYQIGSALEMILLSLALGDRINLLQREKEAAEAEALQAEIYQLKNVELAGSLAETERQKKFAEQALAEIELQRQISEEALRESEMQKQFAQEMSDALAKSLQAAEVQKNEAELQRQIAQEMSAALAESLYNVENQKDEIERQRAAAEQANALKTELLAIAAHDLKNPLQSILGFAYLIREKPDDVNAVAQRAETIERSSKRMVKLINDLLEDAALQAGKLLIQKSAVDVAALLSVAIEHNRAQAEQKSQCIDARLEPNLIAELDADRMREVFDNLISNAIKYSPTGKTIYVEAQQHTGMRRQETETTHTPLSPDSSILISIRDEGQGLTDDDKKKLFGKFQRLSARPTGGESSTGLGLSIVKQLVELHGGRVWAESEGKGKGSTFFVELPMLHRFIQD